MPQASCKFESNQATCGKAERAALGETAGGRALGGAAAQRPPRPRPGDPGGPSWAQPFRRAWLMRTEIDWPHGRDRFSCPTSKTGTPEGRAHIWSWGLRSQQGLVCSGHSHSLVNGKMDAHLLALGWGQKWRAGGTVSGWQAVQFWALQCPCARCRVPEKGDLSPAHLGGTPHSSGRLGPGYPEHTEPYPPQQHRGHTTILTRASWL